MEASEYGKCNDCGSRTFGVGKVKVEIMGKGVVYEGPPICQNCVDDRVEGFYEEREENQK